MFAFFSFSNHTFYFEPPLPDHFFTVESIDTMKYSRDMAREKLHDESFDAVINEQMKLIADSGATHVAIATPYDKEFLPILARWVASARAHGLSVWFRGNFSGWEGWFGYKKITRAEHKKMLGSFIISNPELFVDGDIFTPCPECENGGPGDPRQTGDKNGYNTFLVGEYSIAGDAFTQVGKSIAQYPSMNADIARDVIDKETAKALGGTILIDHYVSSPEQFADDVVSIGKKLNASIGIGEFGAPVPDLNGDMSRGEQAQYIKNIFNLLYTKAGGVPIINYWTLKGGSTALISDNGTPRTVYSVVQSYFSLPKVSGTIADPLGGGISGVTIAVASTTYKTVSEYNGRYAVFLAPGYARVSLEKDGYKTVFLDFPKNLASTTLKDIVLEPIQQSLWYKLRAFWHALKSKKS